MKWGKLAKRLITVDHAKALAVWLVLVPFSIAAAIRSGWKWNRGRRWRAFSKWLWRDALGETLLWLFIVGIVLPFACMIELRARWQLKNAVGKIFLVSGFRIVFPKVFEPESDSDARNMLDVKNERVLACGPGGNLTLNDRGFEISRYVSRGDLLVLVQAPEDQAGIFEDEGKWIFLHPTGCLVALDFDVNRTLFWSLQRMKRKKRKKES